MKYFSFSSTFTTPSTIIKNKIVLLKTQKKLSFPHIHFTKGNDVYKESNIMAVDCTEVENCALKSLQKEYKGSIVWSDNIMESIFKFLTDCDTEKDENFIYVDVNNYSKRFTREGDECNLEDFLSGTKDSVTDQVPFKWVSINEPQDVFEAENNHTTKNTDKNRQIFKEYIASKIKELTEEDKKVENLFKRINLSKN